ncbi:MAG: hypothetical protein IJP03_05840, partial [Christensenellaceae bacterium]|nr:hypothetical protein [Christensenellaceae bacterium]
KVVVKCAAPTVKVVSNLEYITVKWNKISGSAGYVVYRATSKDGTYTKIKTITKFSTVSYKDTGVTKGKTYYYKVRAKGKTTTYTSDYSAAVKGVAKLTTPVINSTLAVTTKSITVKWGKNSQADGYIVYRSTDGSSWKKLTTIRSNSTCEYKDTEASGAYYYSIISYAKISGKTYKSSRSASARAKVLKKPTGVTAKASGSGDYDKITWNAVSGATGYRIYYKVGGDPDSTSGWKLLATVGKVTSYKRVDPPSSHGKGCHYKVRALKKIGSTTSVGEYSTSYGTTWWRSTPDIKTIMLDKVYVNTKTVGLTIVNYGAYDLMVYASGARLRNPGYSNLNFDMETLYKGDGVLYASLKIPAYSKLTLVFGSIDDSGWYDSDSVLYFKIKYDGYYYWVVANEEDGCYYYDA